MKKIYNFLFVLFILTETGQTAVAQKNKFNEGKITYEITYPGTDLDQNMMAMMPTDAVCYVKKDMTRMEMKTGMGSVVSISNAKDGSSVALMDMMGNKMALKSTKEEAEKLKEKAGKPVVKITNETKEIAGYKSTKAIVTMTVNNQNHTFNVWFTRDIEAKNAPKNQIEGIDGFMMEFEMEQQGMNMKLIVSKVEAQPVDEAMFKIPDGYKEMTMEEMMNMMGGKGK